MFCCPQAIHFEVESVTVAFLIINYYEVSNTTWTVGLLLRVIYRWTLVKQLRAKLDKVCVIELSGCLHCPKMCNWKASGLWTIESLSYQFTTRLSQAAVRKRSEPVPGLNVNDECIGEKMQDFHSRSLCGIFTPPEKKIWKSFESCNPLLACMIASFSCFIFVCEWPVNKCCTSLVYYAL